MKRKFLVLLVCIIGSVFLIYANGTNEVNSKSINPIEVTYWTLDTRKSCTEPAAKAFNESQDKIKVVCSYYSTDGIKDNCKIAASSGTLPNMWFNWGGSLGGFYSDNGLTYDISEFAKIRCQDKRFVPSVIELCTRNGELTGYPQSISFINIYYRKDIFDKYDISVPNTFEEFEAACAKLKANGIIPISTAGKYGWHVMRFVELLIEYYSGAELHDSMNTFQSSYNCEPVIKALTKYKEFVDKGYFPEGFVTADPNDTKLLLYSGKAAMDIQGQWYDGNIIGDEQDINLYGIFPFPSGGKSRISSFGELTQFNKDNSIEEMNACADFMDYLYSDELVNSNPTGYKLPLPIVGTKMPEGRPNVPIAYKIADENGTFTITDQAFPTQIADALFSVQVAIANNEMTPAKGAELIQNAIENYLSNNQYFFLTLIFLYQSLEFRSKG